MGRNWSGDESNATWSYSKKGNYHKSSVFLMNFYDFPLKSFIFSLQWEESKQNGQILQVYSRSLGFKVYHFCILSFVSFSSNSLWEKKKKDKARFYNNLLVQAPYHLNGPLHISEQPKFVKVRNLPPSSWVRWVRLGKQAQHRVECGGFVGVSERMVSPIQIPAFQWRPVKSQWGQWICSFFKTKFIVLSTIPNNTLKKRT